jgi:hypothetical protein
MANFERTITPVPKQSGKRKQTPEQIAAQLADTCVDRKFMASLWNTYFERFLAVLSAPLEVVSQ